MSSKMMTSMAPISLLRYTNIKYTSTGGPLWASLAGSSMDARSFANTTIAQSNKGQSQIPFKAQPPDLQIDG